MKKIIRLTERDLTRIVKRVINEQDEPGKPDFDTIKHLKEKLGSGWKKEVDKVGNDRFESLYNGNSQDSSEFLIQTHFKGDSDRTVTVTFIHDGTVKLKNPNSQETANKILNYINSN